MLIPRKKYVFPYLRVFQMPYFFKVAKKNFCL